MHILGILWKGNVLLLHRIISFSWLAYAKLSYSVVSTGIMIWESFIDTMASLSDRARIRQDRLSPFDHPSDTT
jgi:hypothetical protein